MSLARSPILAVLIALAFAPGCAKRMVPLTTTTPFLLQSATDPAELRAAIVRGLQARQFATESEEQGRIIARFSHRGRVLRIAVDYSETDYRVTYLDSAGFNYEIGPDGAPMISAHYDRYVRSLHDTIQSEIARPAREAREAEERERQHQLALAEAERRREAEARQAELNAQVQREALATERERLRTERAQAEAEARRPVIIAHDPLYVQGLAIQGRARTRARFGNTRVSVGFGDVWLQGQAEGRVDAGQLGLPDACRGFYAGAPEHVIDVRRDMDYLRIETTSNDDPTLVMVADDGTVWCDDDGGENLNSRIEGSFPAGTYRIYVGSYQANSAAQYQLLLTEARAAPAIAAAPQPVGPPDCRTLLIERGHHPAHAVHCQGAEPYCAAALLEANHHPAHLVHCQGVDPSCAQAAMRAGQHPAHLVHCR